MKQFFFHLLMDALIVLLIYRYFRERLRRFTRLSEERLCYIRILCELIYTYSHAPESLLEHLKTEMTIKKLLSYHVVEDRCDKYFLADCKTNKKDQLLYMLYEEGFQPKELCVIFELNNLNSVYVKRSRINKKYSIVTVQEPIRKT